MRALRASLAVGAVAGAGLVGSLLVGRIEGMEGGDLAKLAVAMLPSFAATVVAAVIARPLLARASIVWRMVAIATLAAGISLADLIVASQSMFVSAHDAQMVGILVAYSAVAGVGTAVLLAKSSRGSLDRLIETARRLGGGDLSARVGPLDAEPELGAMAITLDDMADRLARSIEHDREVEAMRRDLFAAISHDLRTPLSRLKAVSEALEDGVIEDPQNVRRSVGDMREAVDSMISLVDDLFELVHADAGEVAAGTSARLQSVLDSAVRSCQGHARDKGIELRIDLDGAGDAPCSPRLARVVQNLLVNAVRHTENGEIVIRARLRDAQLVVEITDTGEGIAEGHLPHVFEPFWRGDQARSSPGSGLGLTLTRRIVEHLGGGIDVSSRPGEGARFTVTVPTAGPARQPPT